MLILKYLNEERLLLLIKKLFLIIIVGILFFIVHRLISTYFDVDKELLSSITRWSYWAIAFYIAIFFEQF